jgi:hypothetical protein
VRQLPIVAHGFVKQGEDEEQPQGLQLAEVIEDTVEDDVLFYL